MKLLPKSNSRWKDSIKISVHEIRHKFVNPIHLAVYRDERYAFVNT
jgi:hypothetical protein